MKIYITFANEYEFGVTYRQEWSSDVPQKINQVGIWTYLTAKTQKPILFISVIAGWQAWVIIFSGEHLLVLEAQFNSKYDHVIPAST